MHVHVYSSINCEFTQQIEIQKMILGKKNIDFDLMTLLKNKFDNFIMNIFHLKCLGRCGGCQIFCFFGFLKSLSPSRAVFNCLEK